MSTPNPMATPSAQNPITSESLFIAGLHVDVYGLTELPPTATSISCLWLHHGRLKSKENMGEFAALTLSTWQSRSSVSRGLIAVAFDQRNHGTRLISEIGNQAWRNGNKTHAQDMFGMISGMVVDQGLLLDALEGYIFGNGDGPGAAEGQQRVIDQHLALGVSLGGHSVWQTMFAEPRITAGVIVIGCPDFMFLMTDRARKSKLANFSTADNGASFLGSKDFPNALVAACEKYDPKGILFGTGQIAFPTSDVGKERIRSILDSRILGKKFQVLSGGVDKLVPYVKSKPFLDFFKSAVETWFREGGVSVEDIVYPTAGHKFNDDMVKDAVRFIVDVVSEADGGKTTSAKI
ncbi:hypothetical protein BJ170DRAFT_191318 [Xylariales sp. AK1849]|nr:hypothetical protein BJ170DRAFT_191318 [Xylariales sp. AK1849]